MEGCVCFHACVHVAEWNGVRDVRARACVCNVRDVRVCACVRACVHVHLDAGVRVVVEVAVKARGVVAATETLGWSRVRV